MIRDLESAQAEMNLCMREAGMIALRLQDVSKWLSLQIHLMNTNGVRQEIYAPYLGCGMDVNQAQMYRTNMAESLITIQEQLAALK